MAVSNRPVGRVGKDPELIAFFILLGLAFLAGGIAAIVDGLPYLVLERGFTQVIIGTTVAVAGVLLLAMSWLLVELRRVRKALAASPALSARGEAVLAERASGVAVPIAVGAAGATAAAAAATAAGDATDSPDAGAPAPQPDLFGSLVAEHARRDEPASGWVPAATRFPPEPPPLSVPDEAPAPSPEVAPPPVEIGHARFAVGALPVPPPLLEADGHGALSPEPAPDGTAEPELPVAPGSHELENGEPRRDDERSDDERSEDDRDGEENTAEMPSPSGLDDLRLSLEDRLRQLDVTPAAESRPARDSVRTADELERAGAWMQRPADVESGASVASREPQSVVAGPSWDASVDAEVAWTVEVPAAGTEQEAERLESPEPEAEGAASPVTQVRVPDEEPAAAANDTHPEPAGTAQAADGPAAPEASDEGVVGAYQVGDTYFTIYADGSIQAQTPDGDYSFGSMEELKLFLASERNRLGV
ncbi:MAG: hypothetical protein DI527_06460 [Chelatococcus sp.]|nr:MAG: hypothetical protein DI527_06460 [Chelatococcus sp.]